MKLKPAKNKQTGQDGYALDVTISGKRVRQWFATQTEARAAVAQLTLEKRARKIGLPLPETARAVTLAELYEARARECANNRNWPAVAAKLSEFFKYCPNDAKLSDITSAHVANYLAGLQARKLNPNSINNYLAQVSALLNSAARHFPAAKYNPPTIPRLAPALTTDRVLTGPELQTIYRALTKAGKVYDSETPSAETRRREFIADLFLACALTGARPSEILSLTWPQISFAFSTLTLNSQKTNDRRTMPLTSGLAALFKRRQPANPAKPFAKVCYSTMTYQLQNFGEAIGIPYGEHTGWTLKTLRHTAISTMLRLNADFLSVSAIVGHVHAPSRFGNSMTLHYAHASQTAMREALELLQDFVLTHCQVFDDLTRPNPAKLAAKPSTAQNG